MQVCFAACLRAAGHCAQVAELAKERDFAVVSKHAAAEAAAALETKLRAAAEQHKADVKALQSQISQLKVPSASSGHIERSLFAHEGIMKEKCSTRR